MEDDYFRRKEETFEVITGPGKDSEPLEVTNDGLNYEQFKVRVLELFTASVMATEAIIKKERDSIITFIGDNLDIVQNGLARYVKAEDALTNAHAYLSDIFPGFPDIDVLSNALVELLHQLVSLV